MNLHNEIMNIPVQYNRKEFGRELYYYLHYSEGHRDACRAAAELSLKAEARIEELEDILKEVFADSGFSCLFDELQAKIAEII